MSAGVFSPAKEKEETEKSEGREEGELIELYPLGGLMEYTVKNLVIRYQGATWRRCSHCRVKCSRIS